MPITSVREIRILKMLDHPNVVPVVDIAYEPGSFPFSHDAPAPALILCPVAADVSEFKVGKTFMVFPYMDHDLAGLLENPKVKLEVSHIKQYSKQLLEGTAYLHRVRLLSRLSCLLLLPVVEARLTTLCASARTSSSIAT